MRGIMDFWKNELCRELTTYQLLCLKSRGVVFLSLELSNKQLLTRSKTILARPTLNRHTALVLISDSNCFLGIHNVCRKGLGAMRLGRGVELLRCSRWSSRSTGVRSSAALSTCTYRESSSFPVTVHVPYVQCTVCNFRCPLHSKSMSTCNSWL